MPPNVGLRIVCLLLRCFLGCLGVYTEIRNLCHTMRSKLSRNEHPNNTAVLLGYFTNQ